MIPLIKQTNIRFYYKPATSVCKMVFFFSSLSLMICVHSCVNASDNSDGLCWNTLVQLFSGMFSMGILLSLLYLMFERLVSFGIIFVD